MNGYRVFLVLVILLLGTPAYADYAQGMDAYQSGDYATSLLVWTPLAEQGNVDAQLNLGVDYYLGSGVVQDYIRAYMWLNIVALQGDLEAAKNLNVIGKDMTPTQIGKAKLLARECVAKNYKGC